MIFNFCFYLCLRTLFSFDHLTCFSVSECLFCSLTFSLYLTECTLASVKSLPTVLCRFLTFVWQLYTASVHQYTTAMLAALHFDTRQTTT